MTYTIPSDVAVDKYFDTLPADATNVVLSGDHPISTGDIILPSRVLTIDGNGNTLVLGTSPLSGSPKKSS